MLAIILKDLRSYSNSRKYRIIQFIFICVFALLIFVGTVEFYAQGIDTQRNGNSIDVGKQTYTLLIICLFITQFFVSKHGVEAMNMERSQAFSHDGLHEENGNGALLALTPLANWKILGGKLIAVVIWALWGIWLTIPLFVLSSYIGGLAIWQLVKCGMVILVSCVFFALIGIGFTLWHTAIRAKGICLGCVIAITFLPLIPITPFSDIPMLGTISPVCALLSIFRSGATHLWAWNICLFCVLSLLIFPIMVKWFR